MLKAKLVVVGGDAKSTEVNLKLPTVIGRGKEAGLTVPHALVSRRHTEIFERDGQLFVRDLGSLNGTFVNNTKIEGDQLLESNQLLTLGNITFRAVYEVASKAADVTADPDVKLEEVKTAEGTGPSAVPATPRQSKVVLEQGISDIVSFDETVDVDDILPSGEAQNAGASAVSNASPGQVSTPSKSKNPDKAPSSSSPPSQNKPVVKEPEMDHGKKPEFSNRSFSKPDPIIAADDSQPSIDLESDFFSIGEDGLPETPVSASSLEQLPGAESKVSFIDNVDLGADVSKPKSAIDEVNIDLGDEANADPEVDSSRLASFLKKLPQ